MTPKPVRLTADAGMTDIEAAVVKVLNERVGEELGPISQVLLATKVGLRLERTLNTRTARDAVRNLRLTYCVPIASSYKGKDEGGYFIPQTREEFQGYIDTLTNHGSHMMELVSSANKSLKRTFPFSEPLLTEGE